MRARRTLPLGVRGWPRQAPSDGQQSGTRDVDRLPSHCGSPRSVGWSPGGAGPHSPRLQPHSATRFRFMKRPRVTQTLAADLPVRIVSGSSYRAPHRRPDACGPGGPSAARAVRRRARFCLRGVRTGFVRKLSPQPGLLGRWSTRGVDCLPRRRWRTSALRGGPGHRAQMKHHVVNSTSRSSRAGTRNWRLQGEPGTARDGGSGTGTLHALRPDRRLSAPRRDRRLSAPRRDATLGTAPAVAGARAAEPARGRLPSLAVPAGKPRSFSEGEFQTQVRVGL